MTFETLSLGRIKSIDKFHLDIALPFGALGNVKISDINKSYRQALEKLVSGENEENVSMLSEMFFIGQIVRCSVKKLPSIKQKSKANVELTLDPCIINKNIQKSYLRNDMVIIGSIDSIEDKGYVIETGILNVRAFLPFTETVTTDTNKLSIGSLVSVKKMQTESIDKSSVSSRIIRVTMKMNNDNQPIILHNSPISFDCLQPGMCIHVKIKSITSSCIEATFQTYNVVIHSTHCMKKTSDYDKKSWHTACIISIDLMDKQINASFLPHFISDKKDGDLNAFRMIKIGTRYSDAVIERTDQSVAYYRLPSANNIRAILKKNQAFDDKPPLNWELKLDEKKTCRVIDFDLFDNVAVLTKKTKLIEAPFLALDDVKPGAKVNATVQRFSKGGVLVRIDTKLKGLIPYIHLSDAVIKHPQDRFKIGDKLKSRVILVDPPNQKLILTLKKSLLTCETPILGSLQMEKAWSEIETNRKHNKSHEKSEKLIITAFVIKVSDNGVLLSGLNNIRGWVPKRETLISDAQSIEQFFSKGQTMQCRVLNRIRSTENKTLKPKKQFSQFLLSLQIADVQNTESINKRIIKSAVSVGEVYHCMINSLEEKGLSVGLFSTLDSFTEPKIIADAFLQFSHFSDSPSSIALMRQYTRALFKPKFPLCIGKNTNSPSKVVVIDVNAECIYISAKPSLVNASSEHIADAIGRSGFVHNFEELTIGSQWFGWISHHQTYGIFVQFPGGLRGLAPTRYLADKRAPADTKWHNVYPVGATVEAKVVEVGLPDKQRCLLSLRMLDIYANASHQYVESAIQYAQQCLLESQWISRNVKLYQKFANFYIGDKILMKIDALTSVAVTGQVKKESFEAPGIAFLPNTTDVECLVGQIYPGIVTYINLEGLRIEVCLAPWLQRGVQTSNEKDSLEMKVLVNQTIASSVLALCNGRDIIVVGLKQHGLGRFGVLPAKRCFNDILGGNCFELGQTNRVTIRREISNELDHCGESIKPGTIFLSTLQIYDPVNQRINAPLSSKLATSLLTGSVIPRVYFQTLKGRTAFFRLPNNGSGDQYIRVFCRVINLFSTAKACRKFLKSPPTVGTVFINATVIQSADADRNANISGSRLPLSTCLPEISLIAKNSISIGQLVCGQFTNVGPLCWRLALPCGARGQLHMTCMSRSKVEKTKPNGALCLPHPPSKGSFITCRIIDKSDDHTLLNLQSEVKKELTSSNTKTCISTGESIVLIEDTEDVKNNTQPLYYVSTDISDIRHWNPGKYTPMHLDTDTVYIGYIKRRTKNSLVVSLSYNVDVTIFVSSPSLRNRIGISSSRYSIGRPIKVTINSVKKLIGTIVKEPLVYMHHDEPEVEDSVAMPTINMGKRERSNSISHYVPGSPKRRCRLTSLSGYESLSIADDKLLERYSEFLPKTEVIEQNEDVNLPLPTDQLPTIGDNELEAPCDHDPLLNEDRIAAIAQATSDPKLGGLPAGVRLSSVGEFEIAVRNASSNVHIWSLYMSFLMSQNKPEKVREIFSRALLVVPTIASTSPVKADTFLGNLLMSALNMEIKFCLVHNPNYNSESVEIGCKQFAQLNMLISRINQLNRETVTRKSVDTLSNSGLHLHAEEMAKKLVKENASSPDNWLALVKARLRAGKLASAREAQRNAGRILRLVHVQHFAVGVARLEFEFGDLDRAMNLFEEQIAAHPKRKSLYIDYINLLQTARKTDEAEKILSQSFEKLSKSDQEYMKNRFSIDPLPL